MTARDLSAALAGVAGACEGARLLFDLFQSVRATLNYCPALDWTGQQAALDAFYMTAWPSPRSTATRKTFGTLPRSSRTRSTTSVRCSGSGAGCGSRTGIASSSTGSFLSPSRPTTGARPRSASKSSGRTGRQLKWNVGHLVETRGEAYLRITHCRKEELEVDFSEVYSTYLVRQMRERQQAKIQGRTQFWRTRTKLTTASSA